MLITCCYRPLSGVVKQLNSYLEYVFKKTNTGNKLYFVVVDVNQNCLHYNTNLVP